MTVAMSRGVPQANGELVPEPTMDVRHVADAVAYGELAARRKCTVSHRNGDENAVHRPRLAS